MNILKKIWNWLVFSSANKEKIALTVKAGIPLLVLWGISDTATLSQLSGSIGQLVVSIGELISAVVTVYGLGRKIWLTYE